MKDGVLPLLAALLLAVPVSGLAESDRPSNKWRISVNHNADSDGVIVFSVTPEGGSATQVSVNVPMGLVNVAMKMGAKFVPEVGGLDMTEINEMIQSGTQGRIIDVQDDEGA